MMALQAIQNIEQGMNEIKQQELDEQNRLSQIGLDEEEKGQHDELKKPSSMKPDSSRSRQGASGRRSGRSGQKNLKNGSLSSIPRSMRNEFSESIQLEGK